MKIEEKARQFIEKVKKENGRINAVLELNPGLLSEAKELDKKKEGRGKLYGKIIGVKSNINVTGLHASCASKVLENYKATYDATVIEKIKKEDGLILGMLNCDEFAAGSSGENSAFGPTDNPSCPGFVPGGSSSGSAAAVAADFCDMSLGSDTGGSIRVPASFCGIVGVKPSYGAVSRYGLIDLSMSLDQIGTFSKNVEDAALLMEVIIDKDERDTKSVEIEKIKLNKPGKIKIGVVHVEGVDKRIREGVDEVIEKIKKEFDWSSSETEIKHMDLAIETYHLLCWTEFFSATRRMDGRKYGKKIEDYAGKEVLRRIYGGSEIARSEFAGQYYHKALQIKELIKNEFEKALGKVDCILMPTAPVLAWKTGKEMPLEKVYATDALVIPANLGEVCAISIPAGKINDEGAEKPFGLQIICGKGEEGKMLSIAREIEKLIGYS